MCSTSIRSLSTKERQQGQQRRRLDVAIVGAPNAGKSQLLNVLTQSNVAAVSRKRHTTRDGILGARTVDDTQVVFVDTPGFLRVQSAKQEGLVRDLVVTALDEIQDVDCTLIVIDAARTFTEDLKEALVKLMFTAIQSKGRIEDVHGTLQRVEPADKTERFAIVLNKVDLVKPKHKLLEISDQVGNMAEECIKYAFSEQHRQDENNAVQVDVEQLLADQFPPIFYTSALHDEGVDDIWKYLMQRATPCQEWVLSAGQVTQMSPVERVEEVLREKIYRCLHREVPHQVQQVNRTFQMIHGTTREGDRVLRVDQDLVVRTKSHQKLVMGTGGKTLRRIQQSAKTDLERIFQCPVMLHLQVKLTKSKHPQKLESEVQGTRIEFNHSQ